MAIEKVLPYVISADVNLLMQAWSKETGFIAPPPSFFDSLAEERKCVLDDIFDGQVDVVSEDELQGGMNRLARSSKYPLVSLDKIYLDNRLVNFEKYLDVTRAVDEDFGDLPEKLYPRKGALPVKEQLDSLEKTGEEQPVTVVDDVLFTGDGLVWLAKELEGRNRPIKQAVFGIGIGEGLKKVRNLGIEVQCVREYPDVIDEICERDFLACIPSSGRTLICAEGNYWGAPYFKPFGNPEKWASIPKKHAEIFSKLCVAQSIRLWREIESLSGTPISTDRVPRMIKNLKPNASIVSAFENHRVMVFS